MKVKKLAVYAAIVAVFILYLCFANTLMLMFNDNVALSKVSFDSFTGKDEVYQIADGFQYLGGMYEVAYLQGWAFCETDQDNSDKVITLIFRSTDSDDCYAVETKAQARDDVYGAFRDIVNVYNGMNGIECQFSTVNMKNGTYKFYVAVKENEQNSGISNTGMLFEKTASGLYQVEE